jgi:sporulation protein YlmC with PRC-barrel domain
MDRHTLSATTLIHDDVRNPGGDDLGKIKDIMIDVEEGQVAYAVLEMGGVLGIGGKLFAVPWSAMALDTDNHEFVLDVDEDTLRTAPGFDMDNWPGFTDRDWGAQIYGHYGRNPYWS